jgi:hypothetical protein
LPPSLAMKVSLLEGFPYPREMGAQTGGSNSCGAQYSERNRPQARQLAILARGGQVGIDERGPWERVGEQRSVKARCPPAAFHQSVAVRPMMTALRLISRASSASHPSDWRGRQDGAGGQDRPSRRPCRTSCTMKAVCSITPTRLECGTRMPFGTITPIYRVNAD